MVLRRGEDADAGGAEWEEVSRASERAQRASAPKAGVGASLLELRRDVRSTRLTRVSSFATRSKTVFTWAEGGGTKMHVTFQVDWTGKSMLKGQSLPDP